MLAVAVVGMKINSGTAGRELNGEIEGIGYPGTNVCIIHV